MDTAIKIEGLKKSFQTSLFKKSKVLHSLDLSVDTGTSFGFLGPNGAGKSTTIKLLLNFLQPDNGSLYIFDHKVGNDEFRSNIGYLSEFPCFYSNLTSLETLLYSGRLSGMRDTAILDRAEELLCLVKLEHTKKQRVSTFSKGMKQRLGLACSLVHDPQLLIFDEPMSGLDPVGRHLVKNIIKNLCNKGKTVFFSTHILADIDQLCDNIAVIHKGHLLYQGPLQKYQEGYSNLEEAFIVNIHDWNEKNVS